MGEGLGRGLGSGLGSEGSIIRIGTIINRITKIINDIKNRIGINQFFLCPIYFID
jgi:hypothetical protein